MRVSVIIPTRDRPDYLSRCLPTILANEYPDFEVIVVDQSTTDASERVVGALADPRLRYYRQRVTGKARALNAGLAQAKGDIIALTDDDCTAPSDWLRQAVAVLEEEPGAGIVFGALAAAPHDWRETFISTFVPPHRRRLQGRLARAPGMGMGGNMVVRQAVFERVGGFDECLGPGGRFRASVDWDLAYRALRVGFAVVQDPTDVVFHWGKRDYSDGSAQRLIRNYLYGIGAGLIKYVRCGDPVAAYALMRCLLHEVRSLVANLLMHRRATGVGRLLYLILGALHGFRQPIDRQRLVFSPTENKRL